MSCLHGTNMVKYIQHVTIYNKHWYKTSFFEGGGGGGGRELCLLHGTPCSINS